MEQVAKAPKRYEIIDDALELPYSIHKQLRIANTIQGINEPVTNEIKDIPKQQSIQNPDMEIPYQMSQTLMKYMLFYRILAYLLAISIGLSVVTIYGGPERAILIFINNGITVCIFVAFFIKVRLHLNHLKAKKERIGLSFAFTTVIKILIMLPHPTMWTLGYNHYLHLAILLRIGIIIKFLINFSIYCDERAYRIIKLSGLNASEHLFFAVKSLVESLNFAQILIIYFISGLFFTHCLYLVSMSQYEEHSFFDYYEVVMTSMPTVGFGEYQMYFLSQKIVLCLTIVYAASLNSFVTFSILSQLEMNQGQLSSYWLMKKIQARQHIQHLSKNYIQSSFSLIRAKTREAPEAKHHINFSFRNEYRLRKSLYNSISYSDINNLFAYFRDQLVQLKINVLQTNNMVSVLLMSLKRHRFKKQGKKLKAPQN